MPGVPSSRGCDACRRQKKKCDINKFPCSRCKRLCIPCTGLGQQRYRFKHETLKLTSGKEVATSAQRSTLHEKPWAAHPARVLSNGATRLRSAFVSSISPHVDIKFQLLWNFGGYLRYIPSRLGTSAALDAASDALVAAHRHYSLGSLVNHKVLIKHSRALSALRYDLDDVAKAKTTETLCASTVLMIAQVFIDPQSSPVSHSEGAARILKGRGLHGPADDFERDLLLTLRGPLGL